MATKRQQRFAANASGKTLDAGGSPPLVLVVDDDDEVRGLFVRALERAGFATWECDGGTKAIEAFRTREPAVVLLDSRMPEVDGLAVLRQIRADATRRAIPIIFVTAKGEVSEQVAGLNAGAADYLVKPVPLLELVARVRTQLRFRGGTIPG